MKAGGRHQRRNQDDRERRSDSGGNRYGAGSNQSGSHRCQDLSYSRESHRRRDHSHSRGSRRLRDRSRSYEHADHGLDSPEERRPHNADVDAMSRALHRAARSPFSNDIEWAIIPSRFTRPPFNSYYEKTDPIEHASHYIQMMSLYTYNDVLMCKVFPSSVGPTALRWFNGLRNGSIHSFAELIQEFSVRFVTCSRVSQLVDALLSMKLRVGETLRSYASRY